MTSYINSLVMWPPCQHTKGLLVGPLPWEKSGRETGKKCQGRAKEEEQEGIKATSSLQRHTRLGLDRVTQSKEAHGELSAQIT